MEFGSTVLGAVVEKAMGLIIKVVTPKSRKIHIETVEQLPESAPIVWVHPDALDLDGVKWDDFDQHEMPARGAELTATALNLTSYGVTGKVGRTYRVRVKNNLTRSVMIDNVSICVAEVSPSPSGTLVFQVPQGRTEERAMWCDITSLSTGVKYDALVADESLGTIFYRDRPDLYLAPNEVVQLYIQVSAPTGSTFEFDVQLDSVEYGKFRSRKKDRLRLVNVPLDAEKIYTVVVKQRNDGGFSRVLQRASTLSDAQANFLTSS